MSHTVTIKTEVRDAAAVRVACKRLKLPAPVQGKHELYSGEFEGLGVQLPGWQWFGHPNPAVFNTETGDAKIDNNDGEWGDRKELDRFLQAYAVEKCRIEARRKGHSVTEQQLADGSIKVTIQVGAAA